jgi:hypothetical protein
MPAHIQNTFFQKFIRQRGDAEPSGELFGSASRKAGAFALGVGRPYRV